MAHLGPERRILRWQQRGCPLQHRRRRGRLTMAFCCRDGGAGTRQGTRQWMGPGKPPLRRQHALDGRRDVGDRVGLLRRSAARGFWLRLQASLQLGRDRRQQIQVYPADSMSSASFDNGACPWIICHDVIHRLLHVGRIRVETNAPRDLWTAPLQLAWPQAGAVPASLFAYGLQQGLELLRPRATVSSLAILETTDNQRARVVCRCHGDRKNVGRHDASAMTHKPTYHAYTSVEVLLLLPRCLHFQEGVKQLCS